MNLILRIAREATAFMLTGREHCTTWVLPSENTCHLHILVMSGELPTGVNHYTLIARAYISETGTELSIMEPYYEEPFTSSTP